MLRNLYLSKYYRHFNRHLNRVLYLEDRLNYSPKEKEDILWLLHIALNKNGYISH